MSQTAQVTLAAFFIGAIISVVILIIRNVILKKKDEYVPFGPFLVIGSIACIFLPSNMIFIWFMAMCSAISNGILSIV